MQLNWNRIYVILRSSAANKEDVADLKASYSMGWQRKGSGRAYKCRSGPDQGMVF